MKRRVWFRITLTAAAGIAAGTAWYAFSDRHKHTPASLAAEQALLTALARAVLDPLLPPDPAQRDAALAEHVHRTRASIDGLPPATRSELAQLMLILTSTAGRRWFAGLPTPWEQASPDEVRAVLLDWRDSRWTLKQQAYHGLRDLTAAAYISDPRTWPDVGYPGPVKVAIA